MSHTPDISQKARRRPTADSLVSALCKSGASIDDVVVRSYPDGSIEAYCKTAAAKRKMTDLERFKAQNAIT